VVFGVLDFVTTHTRSNGARAVTVCPAIKSFYMLVPIVGGHDGVRRALTVLQWFGLAWRSRRGAGIALPRARGRARRRNLTSVSARGKIMAFHGKVALVTGAGSGMAGSRRRTWRALARSGGARLDEAGLDETCRGVPTIQPFVCDVTSTETIARSSIASD